MGTITMLSAKTGGQIRFEIKKAPRKLSNVKMVKVYDDRYLALSAKGTIYGIGIHQTSSFFYAGINWYWTPDLAKALNALGVLSKEDMEATIKVNQSLRAHDEHMGDVDSFKNITKRLGITPTKAQLKQIEKTAIRGTGAPK
jgi:hypothetical protein